jgi:hypothetical protein
MRLLDDEHEELKSFMSMHWPSICTTTLVEAAALGDVPQEHALIMKECTAKYNAVQQAGALQGISATSFARWQPLTETSRRCLGQCARDAHRPHASI